MRSAVSVRPFVSTLSFEPTELWPWISVCLGQDFCSPGIESQGHRSRSMQTVCVLYEYLLRYPRSIDWCSRFPTSAGLGRRQQRTPERAGVVTWPAWPRTSIEGSFFLEFDLLVRTIYLPTQMVQTDVTEKVKCRLFTDTSEHIRFLLFSFSVFHFFSFWFREVLSWLISALERTLLIASRISLISYDWTTRKGKSHSHVCAHW